ncbi:winged helix-turn-helix transcriptional regulator [Microbacterium hominis]|uniref:Winged helix-turn-helix transcriptional regulator n=2 Tax=Microbacterium hominis TaxID=162426 RepID=A0A7D4PPQ1_9MICO|nr:winged helix-turn-helix transcriptional regulator [Microbacterium hominis]
MHPFAAMADPVRRRIVDLLASGEHTAGEVAEAIGFEFRISRTAVSKHLRLLRDAGIITVRADLQWRWYRLADEGVDLLEAEVSLLREKVRRQVGWNPGTRRDNDPLAHPPIGYRGPWPPPPPPRRKGPGRRPRPGRRGRQTEPPIAADPERGWFRPTWVDDPPNLEG